MPSLLEALDRKYGGSGGGGGARCSSEALADLPVAIFVPKRSPRLSVPTLLVLNDCDIDAAGDADALRDKCSYVEELDLAKNRLTDWGEVLAILEHMPEVKFVNLSFNRLSRQLAAAQALPARWDRLGNLVLNSTYVTWPSVHSLLQLLPALEELHLSLNDYTRVELSGAEDATSAAEAADGERAEGEQCERCSRLRAPSPTYPALRKLHFSGNRVSSWCELSKLGRAFPELESLVLNECPVSSLALQTCDACRPVTDAQPHDAFSKLRFLNLANTGLATWDEVDRLARFPALRSLRVQGWPLWERCEATEHERRMLLLARLPHVHTLNGGGTVPPEERDSAERAFIRYYMERAEADRPDRYWELVAVHGKLDPLVVVDLRPEKRVRVNFTCGDTSELRTVDVYRTVADLKVRLERLAGFPASRMRLFYVDQELRDHSAPEEMRYPTKQLYSYNIRSGDEIIIEHKRKN